MNFFRLAPVFVLLLCVVSFPSALAVDGDMDVMDADIIPGTSTETFTTDTDSGNITVNVTVPSADSVPASPELSSEVSPAYATRTLDDAAAPADSETMPGLVTALFGSYTPRTQTVTEYLPDGSNVTYTEVVPGLAGLDWPWIASVALFAMSLYCVFRMIGGLFKWT